MLKHAVACFCFLLAVSLPAQERFNNETILKLVKAGIGEDIIVGLVNQQPGKYALSADDMIALKKAGVSDKVIAAMLVRNGESSGQPAPTVALRVNSSSEAVPAAAIPRDTTSTSSSSATDGLTRVFVTDSQSWETRGGWNATGDKSGSGGYQSGGARQQTAEIMEAFNQRCPRITVTNSVERADFALTFDHDGGKGILRRHKIVVFNRDGDDIFSDATRELGNSVKDACEAILRHRAFYRRQNAAAAPPATTAGFFTAPSVFDVTFTSAPPNALVTITGQPIGRTPFTTKLPPGSYKAVFSVDGYAAVSKDVPVGTGFPTTVSTTLRAGQ
jgi:hypothetical protein